ncbi:MAG: hypothetical protein KKD83_10495 [Chloroflexi bacterium]|nr:hypothetical protein [Chloroflexota bacterium]
MGMGKEPSWEMKKAIIDLAAKQGPRPIVIQRDLDRMVSSGGLLEGESVPNFRTIGRVLKKFQTMDREIIVSEFKPYVWSLRNNFDEFRDGLRSNVKKCHIDAKSLNYAFAPGITMGKGGCIKMAWDK